jgi:hypothetical protein
MPLAVSSLVAVCKVTATHAGALTEIKGAVEILANSMQKALVDLDQCCYSKAP